jgi:hypothetical protein
MSDGKYDGSYTLISFLVWHLQIFGCMFLLYRLYIDNLELGKLTAF